uniref:Interleukin n=1 Tax=Chrysemys picta bellii TaxID=8478 RepID=A0A8C3I1X6_CHRPI
MGPRSLRRDLNRRLGEPACLQGEIDRNSYCGIGAAEWGNLFRNSYCAFKSTSPCCLSLGLSPNPCAALFQGDATDGTLYTPEDITVCMAENLNCFHTELRVIQWEHREHTESLSLLIRHLSQLEKLRTCKTDRQCHPCEGHREQPKPQFLSKLLEQLQWDCWHLT